MRIVIVGGGIGGLSCAIGLKRDGHNVTVLEKAHELITIGAGVNMTPNATRALKVLGVLPQTLQHAILPESAAIRRYDNMEKLSEQKLGHLMTEIYEAKSIGVEVLFGHGIASVKSSFPPAATTDNGSIFHADLIVAADGERSICRQIVTGKQYPFKDSGDHVFRVLISRDAVRKHSPDLAHLVDYPALNLVIGPGGHAMLYCLKRDGLLNIGLTMKHEGAEDPPQMPHAVELSEAAAAFQGWSTIAGLLESAIGAARWTLLDTDMPDKWVNQRLLLLGDAAHVMLPYLGQGAAMALEDAVVLSTLLKGHHESDSAVLDHLLQRYTQLRLPRVQAIKAKAKNNRNLYALHDGVEQVARDKIMATEAERIINGDVDEAGRGDAEFAKGSPNFLADVPFRNMLFGYDAEKVAS